MPEPEANKFRGQPGKQRQFLQSSADFVIYGGAAGAAKTYGLLLECLRHVKNPLFTFVIFRRTCPQISNPGGLWSESMSIFPAFGGKPKESAPFEWNFPSGARGKFAHMEHEKNRLDWQGAQIALIAFDEIAHFTSLQVWYMLSRNRSMCGIRPYMRATTNPEADSWVAEFISWWWDQDTGYPIAERSGVIRYFKREGDNIVWSDEKTDDDCRSFTFIAASVYDNKILLAQDPAYLSNLKALPLVERERLLKGNWKIRPAAGMYFRREWLPIVDAAPSKLKTVRYWDLAATEPKAGEDPDWTAGAKLGVADGVTYILDMQRRQSSPGDVERLIRATAEIDTRFVPIWIEQEPGASGKSLVAHYVRSVLQGFTCRGERATGSKIANAGPLSAQAEAGNVRLVRGPWNDAFITEAENFGAEGSSYHDDQIDAASKAFNKLASRKIARSLYLEAGVAL